jgi:hypothetical protein
MTPKAARFVTWRARLPVVAVVVACVAGVVSAVTGAANPVAAMQFLVPGHWVYNAAFGSVFHVDGATGNVDAQARMPGGSGDQVFQGDTSGYVVGSSRITEFGKSTLAVGESTSPQSRSVPVGVETAGGPYLVYQQEGKVVRLGEPQMAKSLGGPVGAPVATRDGTLWLPRTSAGLLCQLPASSTTLACASELPKGHAGALTVVRDRVMFVDTTQDTLHAVESDGLGAGRPLGFNATDDAKLASTDVAGRVAILDGHTMHLVDTGTDTDVKTVKVDLPDGDYSGPVSTGEVVAVVDNGTATLTTFGGDGKQTGKKTLPTENGEPRISRGEDNRLYVDGAEGEHVVVVDKDGGLTDVPITGGPGKDDQASPPQGGNDPDEPPVTKPPTEPEKDTPPVQQQPPDQRRDQNPPVQEQKPPVQQEEKPNPPVVPSTPPGAPTAVSAAAGDAGATVNWGPAPDNRAPITGYTITWPGGSTTAAPGQRAAAIAGLANGTTYVFTVTATNARGTGPGVSSNPVIPTAPFRAASAPTNLTADNETANSTVWANWAAPADMGTGTFAHYLIDIVGVRQATVTGQSFSYNDIQVDRELTVTITAVTVAPDGRQVPGATATAVTGPQPPAGSPQVRLSRGPATTQYCGQWPGCAWMHIELIGFPPNTNVFVDPYSTDPSYSNVGHTFLVDGSGNGGGDQFAYAGVGNTVHVNADLNGQKIRSNDVYWGAG